MSKVKVCVLRTAGTNCDRETAFAFEEAGARVELVHVNKFIRGEKKLSEYGILALPGGFSYGDDIAAGKVLANELRCKLNEPLKEFIAEGKLIIGICNGFQVLVKSGFLPGNESCQQEASLIINDCGSFRDEWVCLQFPVSSLQSPVSSRRSPVLSSQSPVVSRRSPVLSCQSPVSGRWSPVLSSQSPVKCVWARDLPEEIYLPIAHGEGKFVVKDKKVLENLKNNGQVVFKYRDNPNGSVENIAGICDATGRVLGLMPHPERHIDIRQHPRWEKSAGAKHGYGLLIFKNGVEYAKKYL